MGVVYSHSDDEEKNLKKMIYEKSFFVFHTNFVNENGHNTNGSIKQIIFGNGELKEKSYNDLFLKPTSNFDYSFSKVKHLLGLYPVFYDLYEKHNIENFMNVLKIDSIDQIDDILKKLLDGKFFDIKPKTILAKLQSIATMRRSKELLELAEKTGKNSFSNMPTDSLSDLEYQSILDRLYLSKNPDFFNEMILVYVVTIFKEYLKSVLEKVFFICPELKKDLDEKMSLPDGIANILKFFRINLQYDLEEQILEWHLIEEMILRRNRLIHSAGIPDDDYNIHTSNVGFDRLSTNAEYIQNSLEIIQKNQHIINNYLYKQFVNPKFIEQMSLENILD